MDDAASRRRGLRAATRRHPVLAIALLAAVLVLPGAAARGAVPSSQATPGAALPGPGTNQSGIFLNKFDCPGTYGGDLAQLLQNCTVTSNVTFQVLGPNLQQTAQGGIAMQALPAGLYTIREFLPAGYGDPVAFCGFAPTNEQQPALSPVVVYDGYYEFQLGPGQSIYCNWFNIQPGAPADAATLYVNKHFCPPAAEFDAYAATPYELAPACQEPPTPISFAVTRNGSQIATGTAAGAPNALVFSALPLGTVAVVEELPEGYDQPIVFCSVKDQLGNARAPLAPAPVDNDRISWNLNAGDVVFCDWFNVPAPLGTTISVVKRVCPETVGYDRGGYDSYLIACPEAAEGVSFKLDGASTGNPGEQPTDANGQVTWSEMEADHYFLTEESLPGYRTPVAFCAYYDPAALQDRDWQRYTVSQEQRIEFDVADGQSIACSFFNVSASQASPPSDATPGVPPGATPGASPRATPGASPAAGIFGASAVTTLTIRAYRCPVGYDLLAPGAEPAADCTERPDDIGFELRANGDRPSGAPRRADTGGSARGVATFGGVGPGDHRLTRVEFPVGGGALILACQSNRRDFGSYPFAPFALVPADGSVRLSLIAGETLVCDWYEAPAEEQGLTVRVYECGSSEPSDEACDAAAEGVRFVLVPVTGEGDPITFDTDETGTAHLTGLDGTYTLSQVGRQPCALESLDLDAEGNLRLDAESETVVRVFNCA